jgi:hypothetical protein
MKWTEKRLTEWTDPTTGKRYTLKDRGSSDGECDGCVGHRDRVVPCGRLPSCRVPECIWVEANDAVHRPAEAGKDVRHE